MDAVAAGHENDWRQRREEKFTANRAIAFQAALDAFVRLVILFC